MTHQSTSERAEGSREASETEKELLLRVADECHAEATLRINGYWSTAAFLRKCTPEQFEIISRVLREAAEGWRPIETAPADAKFLAPSANGEEIWTVQIFDHPRRGRCVINGRTGLVWKASVWMPIPPPPATETTKTEEPRHDDR